MWWLRKASRLQNSGCKWIVPQGSPPVRVSITGNRGTNEQAEHVFNNAALSESVFNPSVLSYLFQLLFSHTVLCKLNWFEDSSGKTKASLFRHRVTYREYLKTYSFRAWYSWCCAIIKSLFNQKSDTPNFITMLSNSKFSLASDPALQRDTSLNMVLNLKRNHHHLETRVSALCRSAIMSRWQELFRTFSVKLGGPISEYFSSVAQNLPYGMG